LFTSAYFIFFTDVKITKVIPITPAEIVTDNENANINRDLSLIYTNDLFNTNSPIPSKLNPDHEVNAFPEPPVLTSPGALPPVQPQFLEPLEITLTGIMTFGNNLENIAIVTDNNTNEEFNYKIGDNFQDAQIVNIYKNKVLIIRSNGQQETLYLYQNQAEKELKTLEPNWQKVIKSLDNNIYEINLNKFVSKVHSLGYLIELLSLTTAFKQGETIGCRIGSAGRNSLGAALGLKVGDIITTISDIETKTTQDRFEIYQKLLTNSNNKIIVKLLRDNQNLDITYLTDSKNTNKNINSSKLNAIAKKPKIDKLSNNTKSINPKLNNINNKKKFSSTLQKLKMKTKRNILNIKNNKF